MESQTLPVGSQDSQKAGSLITNSRTNLTVQKLLQHKVPAAPPNVKAKTNQDSKKSIQDSQLPLDTQEHQLPLDTIQESQIPLDTLESQQLGPGDHNHVPLPSNKFRM